MNIMNIEMLNPLEKAGIWEEKNKCQFMAPSDPYLGHVIDCEGLHHIGEKGKGVVGAPKNLKIYTS